MADFRNEIEKRRTFAIISHPDAGKTTLTEKFLLYGGAIQLAGAVKGKKNARHAVSDWMEIEKQRGISVTSSVMQFQYEGYCINILDTPGHQDFSEDTYQSPYDLLDEIEKELGIGTYPMNWPIGSGVDFKGVYDREKSEILAFEGDKELRGQHEVKAHEIDLNDAALETILGESLCQTLRDDVELLDGAGYEFDLEKVRHGKLSPVFFGSALTNFGVEPFLESFLRMTTSPLPRQTSEGVVDPFSKDFSAFVFKIQANMNKAHRDRIAFMRICSGKFEKGMEVTHVQGGRKIKLSQPQQMMAQSREIIDEAYAGDIIGVFDPGIFSIGDTICTGKKVQFEGIPTFAPEFFCRVQQKDTMKRKQFVKGTTQIAQEGAIQIFQEIASGMEEVIVGVVGTLQFDVFKYRMENEYNVEIRMETLPYSLIRWIDTPDVDLKKLNLTSDTKKVQDIRGRYLLLFSNEWSIRWALEHNEGLELSEFSR